MGQPYSPPHTEADYPEWFVQGRQKLLVSFAPLLCLSSAIAGAFLVRAFYGGNAMLSRPAAISMAWPTLVFPLVGYFGMFAIMFVGIAVAAVLVVFVTTWRKRRGVLDPLTVLPNVIWSVLIFVFSLAWDGVYGD